MRQRDLLYQELAQLWADGHKHPLIEVVCRWLDLSDIDLEKAFCHTTQEEMRLFLEKHCARPLTTKEEQTAFSQEFRRLRIETYGQRQQGNRGNRNWGFEIISKELEALELPFKLSMLEKAWVLQKTGREG